MENKNAQILIGATAVVGSFEVLLYVKNLMVAYWMNEAPRGYELTDDEFQTLKYETMTRSVYEIAGVVLNCGILVAKIWYGYYPIIWEAVADKLGKWTYVACCLFQIADAIVNKVVFSPTCHEICTRRGQPGVQLRTLATGPNKRTLPVGFMGLLILMFGKDVDPKIWFLIPFVASLDEILYEAADCFRNKRMIETDGDSDITKQVRDVATFHGFPVKNIYKNAKEKNVAEANYYERGRAIIISQKLMSLPEKTAVTLISQEIGLYTRRRNFLNLTIPFIRTIGFGLLMVESFGNDLVTKVFGFDNVPYPYVPMYLAYACFWPVVSNTLYRIQCFIHSRNVMKADMVIHLSTCNYGVTALKAVAGQADKYPIFDSWYSRFIRGYPTVAQRIKNLESNQ